MIHPSLGVCRCRGVFFLTKESLKFDATRPYDIVEQYLTMKKLFLLVFFVPGLAFADRLDDLKDELDQVKAELDELQPEPAYVDTNDPQQVLENQRELKEMFPSYFQ